MTGTGAGHDGKATPKNDRICGGHRRSRVMVRAGAPSTTFVRATKQVVDGGPPPAITRVPAPQLEALIFGRRLRCANGRHDAPDAAPLAQSPPATTLRLSEILTPDRCQFEICPVARQIGSRRHPGAPLRTTVPGGPRQPLNIATRKRDIAQKIGRGGPGCADRAIVLDAGLACILLLFQCLQRHPPPRDPTAPIPPGIRPPAARRCQPGPDACSFSSTS